MARPFVVDYLGQRPRTNRNDCAQGGPGFLQLSEYDNVVVAAGQYKVRAFVVHDGREAVEITVGTRGRRCEIRAITTEIGCGRSNAVDANDLDASPPPFKRIEDILSDETADACYGDLDHCARVVVEADERNPTATDWFLFELSSKTRRSVISARLRAHQRHWCHVHVSYSHAYRATRESAPMTVSEPPKAQVTRNRSGTTNRFARATLERPAPRNATGRRRRGSELSGKRTEGCRPARFGLRPFFFLVPR